MKIDLSPEKPETPRTPFIGVFRYSYYIITKSGFVCLDDASDGFLHPFTTTTRISDFTPVRTPVTLTNTEWTHRKH